MDRARELITELRSCAKAAGRNRFLLQWTEDDVHHVRLLTTPTPQFELAAAENYVRGDAIRVTGETSFNIEFSKYGAAMLADELEGAAANAAVFVEMMVPNERNKRDLIEFRPDKAASAEASAEHDALGAAGEYVASGLLASEDFSDWESADGED